MRIRRSVSLAVLTEGAAICGTPDTLLASDDPRVVEFLAAEADDPPNAPANPSASAIGAPGAV